MPDGHACISKWAFQQGYALQGSLASALGGKSCERTQMCVRAKSVERKVPNAGASLLACMYHPKN